ncbi:MAG: phage tail protein [Erythrobacter sp.]
MATLVLTAVGTAIGGPLGGAIGALIGRQADQRIFGTGRREGPRLKELSVTTSSYGQPIPRQFGRMRVAGTVIWATDLVESSNKQSGGKGQPSVTAYSYSASFAVALSSTPIERVGRIWADGTLLRGANGDLKVGGTLRTYCGHGDDPVDPLIAADKGPNAPAFRDCAYVVFEDLQLADFGNRIPALTFEVFAGSNDGSVMLCELMPAEAKVSAGLNLAEAQGFADDGGPLIGSLAMIDQVFPLICTSGAAGLTLSSPGLQNGPVVTLPAQLSQTSSQNANSRHRQRADLPMREPVALRYYEHERDYQPGVQRAVGLRPSGREAMIDLPATMSASGAKGLVNANAHRSRWQHERISWQIGELDPELVPGRIVRVPGHAGRWLLRTWEWNDGGLALGLERMAPKLGDASASDAGIANTAADLPIAPTRLVFFETASDGTGNLNSPLLYAAASSAGAGWRGAALFAVQGTGLAPIGATGTRRSVIGTLVGPLASSSGLLYEPAASFEVELAASDLTFSGTDIAGLAAGANRVMVGSEILQFARAEPVGDAVWRLSGLLRGRAGTEPAARAGHAAGANLVLLDSRITPLDPSDVGLGAGSAIAAIGIGDAEPAFATLANAGLSRRPLMPVHPRRKVLRDGAWEYSWTRRARGQYRWEDGVDVALVEESESYLVGYGPPDAPIMTWPRSESHFILTSAERATLLANAAPSSLWVRQVGTFSQSLPLPLGPID